MNCSAAILTQWRREDPDRLLQAALSEPPPILRTRKLKVEWSEP